MKYFEIPNDFFTKYNLDADAVSAAGLTRQMLIDIGNDFLTHIPRLESLAGTIGTTILRIPEVHAIKARVKDPEHLIAKICRKKLERPDRELNRETYLEQMTDLVGVRALHLFKSHWEPIGKFIESEWPLHENPVANVRRGDDMEMFAGLVQAGGTIKEHPAGYRSVHYIVMSQPGKLITRAEIQVRSFFEEGWSEIDHQTRYPNHQDDGLLSAYLSILNTLAGAADGMGTFIQYWMNERNAINQQMQLAEEKHRAEVASFEVQIAELKQKIAATDLSPAEKTEIGDQVEAIVQRRVETVSRVVSPIPSQDNMRSVFDVVESLNIIRESYMFTNPIIASGLLANSLFPSSLIDLLTPNRNAMRSIIDSVRPNPLSVVSGSAYILEASPSAEMATEEAGQSSTPETETLPVEENESISSSANPTEDAPEATRSE